MKSKDKKNKGKLKIHPLRYTLMELRKINYLKRNNLPIPSELKNKKFEHFDVDESMFKKKPAVVTSKRISQPIQTTVIKTKGKKKIVKKVIIEEEIEESDDDSMAEGETQVIQTNDPNATLNKVTNGSAIPNTITIIKPEDSKDNENASLIKMGEKK